MKICYPSISQTSMAITDDDNLSSTFYALRGLAIISVAYAHSLSLSNELLQRLGEICGLFGVPIFLFCSGFWFKRNDYNTLLPKLFKNIISPWVIWGCIGFLITVSLGGMNGNFYNLATFLFGHGTWLYYIPVYLIIRICFNYKELSNGFLVMIMILSLLMNIITYLSPSALNWLDTYCTPWQNPLNWAGFFSLGILFKRHNIVDKLILSSCYSYILFSIVFISLFIVTLIVPIKINYWNPVAIPLQYVSIPVSLICAYFIGGGKLLQLLGRNSLLLYLIHIQIGIALANRIFALAVVPEAVVLLVKPIMVLLITMGIIHLIHYVLQLLKLGSLQPYLGIALK